MAEVAAG